MLGFDEIWFGVLYAITIQMGYISPPFGYTLFYIKGTLPKTIGMNAVYRDILPPVPHVSLALAYRSQRPARLATNFAALARATARARRPDADPDGVR